MKKLNYTLDPEEEEILKSVNQSRKEIAQGKGKILRSLRDLR